MSTTRLSGLFFGTPEFALPSLKSAREHLDLWAVVTQPDRPRGRGHKLSPCETKAQAQEWGMPCFSPPSLKKPSEELERLQNFLSARRPDLFIVTAYGNLLPSSWLDLPRLGSINVHASLLPRWRGAAPIQRCLEAGDAETGVCLQKMVLEMDAGDILSEKRIPLTETDTSAELFQRLAVEGGSLLSQYLQTLTPSSPLTGKRQDPDAVTFAPKIQRSEGHWAPTWTAQECLRKTRAFLPWPSVRFQVEEGPVVQILRACTATDLPELSSGTLLLKDKRVFLACAQVRTGEKEGTWVELQEVRLPGKSNQNAFVALQALGDLSSLKRAGGQTELRALKMQTE